MRIGLATPFNKHSAIARFSLTIGEELARRGHEVEVLRTELGTAEANEMLPTTLPVHSPGVLGSEELRSRFDLSVVNIGNHTPFHGRCVSVMTASPSIAIMHDAYLTHFVWGLRQTQDPIVRYVDALAAPESSVSINGQLDFRGSTVIASLGVGAVVHGPHYSKQIAEACPGPVIAIPLCYPQAFPTLERPPTPTDRFVVVVFGIINPNKQVERVLAAIATSETLKARTEFRIVGTVEDAERRRLEGLAAALGIPAPVFVTGWISDEDLRDHLGEADAICCLRYPVFEGGSASLISALYSGRPLVVPDYASYSEVPRDLVTLVSYGDSTDDLRTALEHLDADRQEAVASALKAADWAAKTYSAASYVDALEPLLAQAYARVPLWDAMREIGQSVASMGISFDDPFVQRLGRAAEELFTASVETTDG